MSCFIGGMGVLRGQASGNERVLGGSAVVDMVGFDRIGGSNGWWEAAVTITAKAGPGNTTRYVAGVRVRLLLGFTLRHEGEGVFEFYEAEAEAVALREGKAVFRFYLPPEVVVRDRMRTDPDYFLVDLNVAGEAMPLARGDFSSSLTSAEAVASFRQRVDAVRSSRAGILRAQADSPFANDERRPAPTMVVRKP